jgi:hypothetical protein
VFLETSQTKSEKKGAKFREKFTKGENHFSLLDADSPIFRKKVKKSFDLKTLFHINLRTASAQLNLNISYTRRQVQVIEPVILDKQQL